MPDGTLVDLDDQRVLQDVGIYRYHHPLEDAAAYKERLSALEAEMDEIIKAGPCGACGGHVHLLRIAGEGPQDG